MDAKEFQQLPECAQVRSSHLIRQPGFRTKQIIVVTTLLTKRFSRSKIAELYQLRWQAEVNLKHVKPLWGWKVLALQMVRKFGCI